MAALMFSPFCSLLEGLARDALIARADMVLSSDWSERKSAVNQPTARHQIPTMFNTERDIYTHSISPKNNQNARYFHRIPINNNADTDLLRLFDVKSSFRDGNTIFVFVSLK